MTDVNFANVDCRDVVFSASNPFPGLEAPGRLATFKDCNFQKAQLQDAVFRGAYLDWSKKPSVEMGEWLDTGEGGTAFNQTYCPPFDGADLNRVSFEGVLFQNADFRGATNIETCTFGGAKGLDKCLFDNEEVKGWALQTAQGGT